MEYLCLFNYSGNSLTGIKIVIIQLPTYFHVAHYKVHYANNQFSRIRSNVINL